MRPEITTFTGRQFNLLEPSAEDVSIVDIAHALSLVNRYGGHTREPLSVAQHSVMVSFLLLNEPIEVQFCGLLHDATEAFIGDMVNPLKNIPCLSQFKAIEQRIWEVIRQKFGLPDIDARVHKADKEALEIEMAYLMGPPPVGTFYRVWSYRQAEKEFLARFQELRDARQVPTRRAFGSARPLSGFGLQAAYAEIHL